MNKTKSLLILAAALCALPVMAQQKRVASTGGNSLHETTSTVIGDRRTGCRVTITYGRPSTKDPRTGAERKIWGTFADKALIPYGRAWRMGADEATMLITQQPLRFGETTIPAGAYTLYMVPEENGPSKLAFSKRLGQWGVPVDESQDVARVDLKKETVDKPSELFTIVIEKDAATTNGGIIKMTWENTQFSLPFTVVKD
jgi:hypothetical protein